MTGGGGGTTTPTCPCRADGLRQLGERNVGHFVGHGRGDRRRHPVLLVGVGGVTVAQYGSNPASVPIFSSTGKYFDVALSTGNSFSTITITDCDLNGGNGLEWFNRP